ncbi:hypothetical protein B0H67DRAFT_117258 [Lasiosphaeris hirsuta]|uniref:Uncharacterized protein n=1 Tax=Lasiosphaeris hirsuta TaxID=260670 RepID=A0AA40E725_9PEZI|nr:hypothetical protein B0H67DRAFT_117258 [Lasiosphaeris hirsuta]
MPNATECVYAGRCFSPVPCSLLACSRTRAYRAAFTSLQLRSWAAVKLSNISCPLQVESHCTAHTRYSRSKGQRRDVYARIKGLALPLEREGRGLANTLLLIQDDVFSWPNHATCPHTCILLLFSCASFPCLCSSEALSTHATACVMNSCMVKHSLSTKNITLHLCSVEPKHNSRTEVVYAVFIGLTDITVFPRLLARLLTKAYFWWDDLFNLFGLCHNHESCPAQDHQPIHPGGEPYKSVAMVHLIPESSNQKLTRL